jgi:hypothetical protein
LYKENSKFHSKFFHRTESESIERLNDIINGVNIDDENENTSLGSDPFEAHETSSTTSENPLEGEEEGATDHDENILIDDNLTSEKLDKSGEFVSSCRGDDQFRCGKTSVYICEVQKCDGIKNCPNGEDEDEISCHSGPIIDTGGEESGDGETTTPHELAPKHEPEPTVKPIGDFIIFIISLTSRNNSLRF